MGKLGRRRTTQPGGNIRSSGQGRGRRSTYNSTTHPVLGRWMARCGLTDEQIAQEFEVTRQTIYNWRDRYPEFDEALREGKELANARVEDSLYSRAVGFTYDEIHEEKLLVDGEETPVVKRKRITKRVVPDVQAAIYWLTNRDPERWKAKQQLELTGKDGEKIEFNVTIKAPTAEGDSDGVED